MSYVAPDPGAFLGQSVPDGQCVAFVRKAAGCPPTNRWAPGVKARGSKLAKGTAIAVFQDGRYNNHEDGRSHAAILLRQTAEALVVVDQWIGQVVHEREIRFKAGAGKPVNDGDAYSVIEDRAVLSAIGLAISKASILNGGRIEQRRIKKTAGRALRARKEAKPE